MWAKRRQSARGKARNRPVRAQICFCEGTALILTFSPWEKEQRSAESGDAAACSAKTAQVIPAGGGRFCLSLWERKITSGKIDLHTSGSNQAAILVFPLESHEP
jgi:hypothetical protein